MPRFPLLHELGLPARFVRSIPGRLHPDGRRYLPLLIFDVGAGAPIGVVDRHHLIAPDLAGSCGMARLVFLLSNVGPQPAGERREGIVPEIVIGDRVSTAPEAFGRVVAVPTWEEQRGTLQFESLLAEFLLDIGSGIVGVRTVATAERIENIVGKQRIEPGDWVRVGRSRIDILQFEPEAQHGGPLDAR